MFKRGLLMILYRTPKRYINYSQLGIIMNQSTYVAHACAEKEDVN